LGMIMSVSTLIIWSRAATPSSLVNLSINVFLTTRFALLATVPGCRSPSACRPRVAAALVTCPKDKDRRGIAMSMADAVSRFSVQVAPGHRGGVSGVDLSRPLDPGDGPQIKDAWHNIRCWCSAIRASRGRSAPVRVHFGPVASGAATRRRGRADSCSTGTTSADRTTLTKRASRRVRSDTARCGSTPTSATTGGRTARRSCSASKSRPKAGTRDFRAPMRPTRDCRRI
jgi:hypothetical protein